MEKQPTDAELGELELLRRQLATERRQRKDLLAADASSLAIAQAIRDVVPTRPTVPVVRPHKRNLLQRSYSWILDISDVHYGEVVDADATGWMWQYNMDIAGARFNHTVDQAIDVGRFAKIGKMTVILGGDLLSGKIHDDLERTNEVMVMEQALDFSDVAYSQLEKLIQSFPEIEVVSVAGNHTRLYDRPHFKHKQAENFDYLIAKMLEEKGKKQKGLSFITPKSFWTVFESEGRMFMTMHGDTNKQQHSQGISFYAVEKELRKWWGMGNRQERPQFDDIISHHLHTLAAIPVGYSMAYINGSMKGGDEYTQAMTRPPSPAQQRMLITSGGEVKSDHAIKLDAIGKP